MRRYCDLCSAYVDTRKVQRNGMAVAESDRSQAAKTRVLVDFSADKCDSARICSILLRVN